MTNVWEVIQSIIDAFPIEVKIVFNDGSESNFSSWLNFPSEGYGDIKLYGPFRLVDAELILLNPIEKRKLGRLLKEKIVDHSDSVSTSLEQAHIPYDRYEHVMQISVNGTSGAPS